MPYWLLAVDLNQKMGILHKFEHVVTVRVMTTVKPKASATFIQIPFVNMHAYEYMHML